MTTEDDFQKALDKNPTDWQTRLVLADWLQERGDVRADGYRALGLLRRVPVGAVRPNAWCDPGYCSIGAQKRKQGVDRKEATAATLPYDWFRLTRKVATAVEDLRADDSQKRQWACSHTRREVEDCAARAFAQLPTARRAELLAPQGA